MVSLAQLSQAESYAQTSGNGFGTRMLCRRLTEHDSAPTDDQHHLAHRPPSGQQPEHDHQPRAERSHAEPGRVRGDIPRAAGRRRHHVRGQLQER